MRYSFYLFTLLLLTVNIVIAQPCNDTLNATSNAPEICSDRTLFLFADSIQGATYQWTGPKNFSSNIRNPEIHDIEFYQWGYYKVTATKGNCTYTDSVLMTVKYTIPKAHVTVYPPACIGDSVGISTVSLGIEVNHLILEPDGNLIPTMAFTYVKLQQGPYKIFSVNNGCTSDTSYNIVSSKQIHTSKPYLSLLNAPCNRDTVYFNTQAANGIDSTVMLYPWGFTNDASLPLIKLDSTYIGAYRCFSINDFGCISDTSDAINITPWPLQIPGVAIYGNADTGPFGKTTFTSYVSKAGYDPVYTWMKNGISIHGATGPNYTAINGVDILPGDEISLQVIADITPCPGIGISNSLTISQNLSVINAYADKLSIYPNPNNGIFTVSDISNDSKGYTITIVNNLGQEVYHQNAAGENCHINATFLPTGIYTLKLQTEHGGLYQKVVINR